MKVFLKILTPKLSTPAQKEFTIEDIRQCMTILDVVSKLKDMNNDLYSEISEQGSIHSNYICLVNNEIIYDKEHVSLKDGDKLVISFAVAGG